MSQISVQTFEKAVRLHFEPIARDHVWPLLHNSQDIYEVPSPHFVMRIRFGAGFHTRTIDVTLAPSGLKPEGVAGDEAELGLFAVAGYNGVEMQILPREQTEVGLLEYAAYLAAMAAAFALPYLLGSKVDWDHVRDYWRAESAKEMNKIKGYTFPPSAQKR